MLSHGTKIALGSDAQGDFMYYGGTDWERLPAGTSGQAILSGGSGADPTWGSAGDFKNGGDAGGANRTLGNTDAYSLGFETNDVVRLSLSATGFVTAQGGFGVGNTSTVSATISTPDSENIMSVGPVTIDSGVTVTVGASGILANRITGNKNEYIKNKHNRHLNRNNYYNSYWQSP